MGKVEIDEETSRTVEQTDKEIVSIIGDGLKLKKPDLEDASQTVNPALETSPGTGSGNGKSPDFSFVNLSAKPRQTLNFLQRNLSSPSFSLIENKLENSEFFNYDNFRISVDTSEFSPSIAKHEPSLEGLSPAHVFNPKKYWLKCSSVTNDVTETLNRSPTQCNQPLKKRRHLFHDCDSPQPDTTNEDQKTIYSRTDVQMVSNRYNLFYCMYP